MSLFSFFKAIKEGSDDYVRNQLYSFNDGKFDYLPEEIRSKVAYIIGDEMDLRHLW